MFLPTTLQEAILALDDLLSDEDRAEADRRIKEEDPADVAADLHHSLGRYLRNTWGLWAGGPLARHLREDHGIVDPDNMSHHIIVAYLRRKYPTHWEHILKNSELSVEG